MGDHTGYYNAGLGEKRVFMVIQGREQEFVVFRHMQHHSVSVNKAVVGDNIIERVRVLEVRDLMRSLDDDHGSGNIGFKSTVQNDGVFVANFSWDDLP